MFCSRKSKLRLENIHERTLRLAYNVYEKSCKDLLAEHVEISIHQKHLQFLATEVFKSADKLNPKFMWYFFENHEIPYNLSCKDVVKLPGTNTAKYGINSLIFRDAMLWNIIPKNIKLSKALPEFKRRLKNTWYLVIVLHVVFSIIEKRVLTYSNNCLVSIYCNMW